MFPAYARGEDEEDEFVEQIKEGKRTFSNRMGVDLLAQNDGNVPEDTSS